jgi:hypothetical protein
LTLSEALGKWKPFVLDAKFKILVKTQTLGSFSGRWDALSVEREGRMRGRLVRRCEPSPRKGASEAFEMGKTGTGEEDDPPSRASHPPSLSMGSELHWVIVALW